MFHRIASLMLRALCAVAVSFSLAGVSSADTPVITISTNNTPSDRTALEALSKEAFRRSGVELKLVSLPSERSLYAANDGEVDGEGLRIAGLSAQYPNLVQVPERYIGISFVAFARDPAIRIDQGWASLQGHRVAFITGWKLFESQAGGARVVTKVDKAEQLFRMLEGGRIDLALYTLADGLALVKALGLKDVVPVKPSLKDVDMFLYLHKRHEALVPKIAAALRAMKADGSYRRILDAQKN